MRHGMAGQKRRCGRRLCEPLVLRSGRLARVSSRGRLLWRSTRKLGHGAAVQWCCDRVFSRLVGHSIPGCLWKCGKEQASGLPYWVRLV
jgi:hypothetical protein